MQKSSQWDTIGIGVKQKTTRSAFDVLLTRIRHVIKSFCFQGGILHKAISCTSSTGHRACQ